MHTVFMASTSPHMMLIEDKILSAHYVYLATAKQRTRSWHKVIHMLQLYGPATQVAVE